MPEGYTFDGLFDAAIHAFATSTTTNTGSTSHTSGKPGGIDVKLTDTGRGTSRAEDAGNGTVDVKSVSTTRNLTYLLTVPPAAVPPADLPPAAGSEAPSAVMPAAPATKVTIASIETAVSLPREPVVAIEDLWRFLVAHPDKAALAADQAELKTRLKALIPLSTGTSADITLSGLAVTTSLGDFGLDSMVQHYDDNSPQAEGGVVMRFAMAGLKLPQDLAPAWSAPLVPTRVEFGQSYGPVDLKPGLTMAIDAMDLTADKPFTDAQAAAILASFGGDKTLRITPGTIVTPTITARFEGEALLVKPLPTGTATIAATGLDKAIDAVQAAASDNPGAGQAVAMLMAAKALGKAEGPDSYSWRIVAEAGGVVTINGQPFGGTTPGTRPPRRKQPRLTP